MIHNMYLVQRVERRHELRNKVNPSIDDRYQMDYMGSAEYEFGSLPKSLKRICKELDKFVIHTSEIKDHKGNSLKFFIEESKIADYMQEISSYLNGKRRLKEYIHLKEIMGGVDWSGKPLDQSKHLMEDIWWDIDNDVWFTFTQYEIENIKSSIAIVKDKKKSENQEGWY